MKKLIPAVLAATVLAGVVYAAGPARYDTDILVTEDSWTIANSLATNVALLSGDNGGAKLIHGGGLAVCVSAESGQTITSGTMRAYVYMPVDVVSATSITWRWITYPALDWVLAASVRDQYSGDKSSLSGLGRFAYVEDNIVASGGTTVQTTYSMRLGDAPMKSFLRILWGVALTASIAFLAWERFKPTPVVISPDPAILSNYVQGKQWMRHARSTPYYLKREVGKEALGQPQTPTYQGQPASFTTLSITGATPTPLNGISLTGGTELTFFAAGTPSWGISGGSGGELYSIGGARPIGDSGTRVGNIFSQGAYNQSGSSVNTFSGHSDFTGVNAGNYAIGLNSGTTGICFNGSGVSGCTLGIQSASGTGALTFTTTGGSANFSTDIDLPDLGKFQWSATNYMQFNSNMFAIISNGGQIFTGERGLTANIYPGTGLTTTQLGGLISCNTTSVGNTGTTGPDDLQVYNLPASTLTSTNRCLRIVAKGTQANNTNTKQIRLAIGSGPTTIITKALQQTAVGTGDTWKIEVRICRTGSSAQDFDAEGYNYGGTTVALTDGPTVLLEDVIGTLTFTETSAQDIKTIAPQATATTTDDVKSELLCVYYE